MRENIQHGVSEIIMNQLRVHRFAAEIACVYVLGCGCVCLHSTQAVQMMPLLQMKRLIRQQREKWKINKT